MPNFDQYVMRHGEAFVQSLIEQVERSHGIRTPMTLRLEDRWDRAMSAPAQMPLAA